KKLEGRRRKLLRDHGRAWLGEELAAYLLDQQDAPAKNPYRFEMWRGWLDSVTVPCLTAGFARAPAGARAARLLRVLVIEGAEPGGAEALAALRGAAFLPHLSELRLGTEGGALRAGQAAELLERLARPVAA